jgi:hypothetical protein
MRTVVIQNHKDPDAALMKALPALLESGVAIADRNTHRLVEACSDTAPEKEYSPPMVRDVSNWSPRGRLVSVQRLISVDESEPTGETGRPLPLHKIGGIWEDVTCVVELAALLCAEHRIKGACRLVSAIVEPKCVRKELYEDMIRDGSQDIFASGPPGEMLTDDLRYAFEHARQRVEVSDDADDWMTLACTALAWGGYHHKMRQLIPTTWTPEAVFRRLVSSITSLSARSEDFVFHSRGARDVEDVLFHGILPLVVADKLYIVVYSDEISKRDRLRAAMLLSVCKEESVREACIKNVKTGVDTLVTVEDRARLLGEIK